MKSKNLELPTLYVGIDVHLKNWSVTVLGEAGFKKQFSCSGEIEVFQKSVQNKFPNFNYECAYEAGFCGFWIHNAINKLDHFNCIVVNPADIPTTGKEKDQKDDPRDSLKIAQQLKAGTLNGIYVPNESEVGLRELQRLRFSLVKDRSRIKNRIKSVLNLHGIKVPKEQFASASSHWSGRFIKWLKAIKFCASNTRYVLDHLIELLENIRYKVADITKQLRNELENGKTKQAFEEISKICGIGVVSAATIITEFVEMKRFSSYDKTYSFVGLIPSTGSSGDKDVIRGLTNRCNVRLRSIFIEAAWIAIGHDHDLFNKYHQYKRTMSSNKAIVRIAKKLVAKVRYIMLNIENHIDEKTVLNNQ